MEQKTFTIQKRPNVEFRPKEIMAIEFLTIRSQIDFDDYEKTLKFYSWILEHLEVNIANTWTQVKQKDIYYPLDLKDDLESIEQLVHWFWENIFLPVFTKSKGLTKNAG